MSVSKKVLRKMKKVMGVISAIPVLAACSSQVSYAKVNVKFDSSTGTLHFSGNGKLDWYWQNDLHPSRVKCVIIRNGITEIGYGAFRDCESLKSIYFSDSSSVTKIGDKAFRNCKSLEEIVIPNSVDTIGAEAFKFCKSLEEIVIPNFVRRIDKGTFEYCKKLKKVELPGTIEEIGAYAFRCCETLKNISIPGSIRYILPCAFYECKELVDVRIGDSFSVNTEANAIVMSADAFDGCHNMLDLNAGSNVITWAGTSNFVHKWIKTRDRFKTINKLKYLANAKKYEKKVCRYCLAFADKTGTFYEHHPRNNNNYHNCDGYVCCVRCMNVFLRGGMPFGLCPCCGLTIEDRYLRRKI